MKIWEKQFSIFLVLTFTTALSGCQATEQSLPASTTAESDISFVSHESSAEEKPMVQIDEDGSLYVEIDADNTSELSTDPGITGLYRIDDVSGSGTVVLNGNNACILNISDRNRDRCLGFTIYLDPNDSYQQFTFKTDDIFSIKLTKLSDKIEPYSDSSDTSAVFEGFQIDYSYSLSDLTESYIYASLLGSGSTESLDTEIHIGSNIGSIYLLDSLEGVDLTSLETFQSTFYSTVEKYSFDIDESAYCYIDVYFDPYTASDLEVNYSDLGNFYYVTGIYRDDVSQTSTFLLVPKDPSLRSVLYSASRTDSYGTTSEQQYITAVSAIENYIGLQGIFPVYAEAVGTD